MFPSVAVLGVDVGEADGVGVAGVPVAVAVAVAVGVGVAGVPVAVAVAVAVGVGEAPLLAEKVT